MVKKVDYSKIDEEQIYKDLIIKGKKTNKQIKLIGSEGEKVSIGRNLTSQDRTYKFDLFVCFFSLNYQIFVDLLFVYFRIVNFFNPFYISYYR